MKYRIETFPSFTLAGFAHHIKREKAFHQAPAIRSELWAGVKISDLLGLLRMADYRTAGISGAVIESRSGATGEMTYMTAVTTSVATDRVAHITAPEGMEVVPIPAATWIGIDAGGDLPDAVQNIYKRFYSECLPGLGYELEDLPVLECYMQENRQEVWIAVR